MANGGGMEIERLQATVGVDLSELRTGLASAQAETRTATAGMAGSFDAAATKIDAASKRVAASAGSQRQAMQLLSYQVGDVTSQLAAGVSPMMIFAQQGDQTRIALSQLAGTSSGFAAFMGGPWGAAIFGAATIVGILAVNLLGAADASDEAAKATDALKEAEERLANATAAANHQTRQGILDDIARANSLRQREIQTRKTLQAELELARERAANTKRAAEMQMADGSGGTAARAGLRALQGSFEMTAADIDKRLAEQDAKIARAGTAIRAGQRQIADRDIAAATDPTARANQRLEDATDRYSRMVDAGTMSLAEYKAKIIEETRTRDSTIEGLKEDRSSGRSAATARNRALREQERAANLAYRQENQFQRALGTAQGNLISAKRALATSATEQAQFEREAAQQTHDQAEEEILTNRDYSDAQKARLAAINDEVLALRQRKISLDEIAAQERLELQAIRDAADMDELRRRNELDLLSQQEQLARTAAERRAIALRIVQLDHDLAVARQQEIMASAMRVLASEAATEAEKAAARAAMERAQATVEGLEARLPGDVEIAKRRNRDVLSAEGFGQELGDTLEAGILEALKGKSLKEAMRDGLFNLLNNAMEEAFNNLSNVLFGKDGLGGALGALLGGIFAPGGGIGGGSRAVGGPVLAGAAYNVGAGEKFVPSTNGRVLSRADAMAAMGGGGVPFQLSITVSGARGNQEIMEMVRSGVKEGIGQYDRVVGDRVDNDFRRRA